MKQILDIGVLVVTVLLMLTVGIELETSDFRQMRRRTAAFFGALLLPALVLPVLGFALARALGLPSHLCAGILLLAACPVGDIANFYTLLARGNLALSVSVNGISCLFSVVTLSVAFALYDRLLGEHYAFAVPAPALILRLGLVAALPVLTGMSVRRWKPGWANRCRKPLRSLCLAGIVFVPSYVVASRWSQVAAEWRQTAIVALLFMGMALVAGFAVARLLRLKAGDSITMAILFAVRNVALATAIAVTLLNRTEFAVFTMVYFLAEVPLLLSTAATYRVWSAPRATPLAQPAL